MMVGKCGNKLETILFDLNNFQWFCRLRLANKLFEPPEWSGMDHQPHESSKRQIGTDKAPDILTSRIARQDCKDRYYPSGFHWITLVGSSAQMICPFVCIFLSGYVRMCGRGVWNEGASIKHHAIICCGIVCFDSSLPLFPFGLELSKLSKSQVKKCLTFSSSVGYSWISCRLYRRFETCNCSTMMLL